jgi:hypothetical protein
MADTAPPTRRTAALWSQRPISSRGSAPSMTWSLNHLVPAVPPSSISLSPGHRRRSQWGQADDGFPGRPAGRDRTKHMLGRSCPTLQLNMGDHHQHVPVRDRNPPEVGCRGRMGPSGRLMFTALCPSRCHRYARPHPACRSPPRLPAVTHAGPRSMKTGTMSTL